MKATKYIVRLSVEERSELEAIVTLRQGRSEQDPERADFSAQRRQS